MAVHQAREQAEASASLIAVLSAGNFAIGMGAFVVIGILEPIAQSYEITASRAGWILTAYSVAYALGSPLAVALSGAWSRRTVLLLGFSLFALGSLLSAVAPEPLIMMLARIITALGAGLVTPVAASVAIACSAPANQGRSLSRVFFGLTLAQVLGVPAGSWLGYTFGWPVAFGVVVFLSLASLVGVALRVPKAMEFQVNSLSTLSEALLDWRSLLSVLFTATFIAAVYVLYTYLAPVLSQHQGYGRNGIATILLVFGIGAVFGNMLGGILSDRFGPTFTLLFACLAQLVFLPVYSLLPLWEPLLLLVTLLWSVCGWSFMVAQQSRIVRQTPKRQSVVLALNAAAIYVGVALGSALGSVVADLFGFRMLGLAAGICSILALLHLYASERMAPE